MTIIQISANWSAHNGNAHKPHDSGETDRKLRAGNRLAFICRFYSHLCTEPSGVILKSGRVCLIAKKWFWLGGIS